MATTDESFGVKRYLHYVKYRTKLLKINLIQVSDNQINYYESLSKSIDEYANTHKLFVKYIVGKITLKEMTVLLGESERQTLRYLKRQREMLIAYIQEKEIEYFAKFPFEEEIKITGAVLDERV